MNVYDFDKTLYRGDSTLDFYRFCLTRQPGLVRRVPGQCLRMFGAVAGRAGRTAFKQGFYSFLPAVRELDGALSAFWEQAASGMNQSLVEGLREGDLVISASPSFLLAPVCEQLGVALLASEVDPRTGACLGANCRGEEKVRRLREAYPDAVIDCFYSDSRTDAPLAALANRAYFVQEGHVEPW